MMLPRSPMCVLAVAFAQVHVARYYSAAFDDMVQVDSATCSNGVVTINTCTLGYGNCDGGTHELATVLVPVLGWYPSTQD